MRPPQAALWDAAKIVPTVVILALLQVSSTPGLSPYSAGPDFLLILIVALTLWRGMVTAAVTGFFAGLLVNSMVYVTLGLSSLLYLIAVLVVDRLQRAEDPSMQQPSINRRRPPSSLVLVPWVVLATVVVQISDAVIHRMLGVDIPIGFLWWHQVVPAVIQTGLVALILAPIFRRMFPDELIRNAGITTA